ncbi:MAG: carbamoyltransferase HypF, partial [Candidatus Thermoplasmatota archaeon]|nr:carbamoyltransferase HypF [Candidatus Thermoplasmatota archaeon]
MQRIHVNGIVQGVGFRPFIYRLAVENNFKGYVRNLGDAGVEIVLDCDEKEAQEFVKLMFANLPPLARIYDVKVEELRAAHFGNFQILESLDKKEGSGSVIPPDVGMCDKCLAEMRSPKDRRHNYFFTTCTDCGPRFTIIDKLPYDRPHTTMRDFPMDADCAVEYKNPLDRRYHAQTVACKDCGPRARLTDKNGKEINTKSSEEAIWETSRLLSEGAIVAIKGNGGFHIAAATSFDVPVSLLRQRRRRKQQPFAVMARDIETAKSFAEISAEEEKLLTSSLRPIVLLRKNGNYDLAPEIAPGLHNIGVMLPYTGMHHLLFDRTKERAIVMTSANLPGDPMVMDNNEAVQKLGNIVDYFLFHDREIAQRCDDSVIRFVAGEPAFIRRSRGYAPAPVEISEKFKGNGKNILALGAELCVTSCILNGKRAFLSQHIGDVEKPDTLAFLEDATRRLIHLTNTKPEAIVCDLHPQFATTRLARRMSEEFSIPLKQVQHHWAHA